MDSEKNIQSQIIKMLNKLPQTWVVKFHATPYSVNGVPDLIGCCKGKFFAMEVKTPEGTTTTIQQYQQKMILKSGGICDVVRSVDDAAELIRKLLEGNENE
jgi:Holliday junction resolvase